MGRREVTVKIKEVTEGEFEFQVHARAVVIKDFDPEFAHMRWEEIWESEQRKFLHIARQQLRSHFTVIDSEPLTKKVLIRGLHQDHFRTGQWAELIGIQMFTPRNSTTRECYAVRFEDGQEDLWPVEDPTNTYEFKDASE
jgi:hypothetical protein